MITACSRMRAMDKTTECVIVGAGAAGLSAALFLARAGRSTIVFDAGKKRISSVSVVREHLGFDGVSSAGYLAGARSEALRYGADVRDERVIAIRRTEAGFEIESDSGITFAKAVVLATGAIDLLPPLTGLTDNWGDYLRVCPCFDGYEIRGERFVVFGLPNRMAQMASWVWMWSRDVTVVSKGPFNSVDAERLRLLDIRIDLDTVTGLVTSDIRLAGVNTKSGRFIECDAAWVAADIKAASPLAASICKVDENGMAQADKFGRTSTPGVFAVGNASDPVAHLAHASAAGTTVGPMVTLYLLEQIIESRKSGLSSS
jgi:thioredoxin reductase